MYRVLAAAKRRWRSSVGDSDISANAKPGPYNIVIKATGQHAALVKVSVKNDSSACMLINLCAGTPTGFA
jgi:uncharacterized membrane protein